MSIRLTTAAAVWMAIAAILAGCGGGDDSSQASGDASSAENGSSSLSKAAFLKRANAACLQQRESSFTRLASYRQKYESESENQSEEVIVTRAIKAAVLATVEAEIRALRALGAPEGEEQRVEGILAALQATVDEVRKMEKTAKEVGIYFRDGNNEELRAYGLAECQK